MKTNMLLRDIKIIKNPFLFFLPVLVFYVIFIFILSNNVLWGDEHIYIGYANNLLHGFYSSPPPKVSLSDGPGYSLFILPFVALHLPLIAIRLLNAVLLYLSVILLFKVLIKFVPFKKALLFSLLWACYYNYLDFIALICSETLAIFLISVLLLLVTRAFDSDIRIKTNKYVYLSGFIMGCLILTKVIFGYVLLCMIIGSGFLWIINRKVINYQKAIIILLIAFTTVVPYLIYTYHLTGKIYYLGTSGGNNLYWMSTPYEREYGSWFPSPNIQSDSIAFEKRIRTFEKGGVLNLKNRSAYVPGYEDSLKSHHRKDFEEILKFNGAERDDAFKKIAIINIKTYPGKYIENCFSNIGRILFNYPYSYTLQKPGTLIRFPLNGIIVVLMLFCIIPTFINWKRIIFPIRFMLFFALIYLGGSIFGSAEFRMFTVIVPIFLFWIAIIIHKTIKINIAKW
jgi:4-amino-4-deoxy-L-arabinose transferase-like glycosyltransferase